jgi:arsenite methyltransferase
VSLHSQTVAARWRNRLDDYQGKECLDYGHSVIYRGPYAEVRDEEGHIYPRWERIAVCARTYRMLTEGPYQDDFIGIPPAVLAEPTRWCAPPGTIRPASVTKGASHAAGCDSGLDCC